MKESQKQDKKVIKSQQNTTEGSNRQNEDKEGITQNKLQNGNFLLVIASNTNGLNSTVVNRNWYNAC
jgi:hypothetical protein